ncbi:MAG: ATP-binding cassette domain-containing protein, partial [Oscillospiraceae bacterium]|nr:ATP-binding cassette domain-containing protein [Oscillospiraceae bacterium]
MENAIEIKDLKMNFGKDEVLKGITHSFEKGKVHGIVGNNGSGKTVMMKCICGFLKPTSGTVKVNGKLIGRQEDFPKSLGLIIEAPGFLPHLSGFRNLSILASVNKKINKQRIKDTIRLVGLDPDMKKP